jgi:hypothetical protein
MRASAALAERALSERIRQTWRLRAVDDDLLDALGRRVLIAGKDLRNFGMELKHVDNGELDLNDRQFDVLRRTRADTPPFVFQFSAPPDWPWSFRLHALRKDSLEALGGHPYVTVTEREAEAFTMALTMGSAFTTTDVTPARFRRTEQANRYEGTCLACGGPVATGRGICLAPTAGTPRWSVLHRACDTTVDTLSTVEMVFAGGEPAVYLAHFADDLVADHVWPEVIPPHDYAEPPLRPAHVMTAARYLEVAGVFDRAPERVHRAPTLTVVRQRTSAAEIAERVLRQIRAERGDRVDTATVQRAVQDLASQVAQRRRSPWIDEAALRWAGHHAAEVVASGRPGPFGRGSQWEGVDTAAWDWAAIRQAEANAQAKLARLPTCERCGGVLSLGQSNVHSSCSASGS